MIVADLIGNVLAVFFTLLVLLYAFGDNALFRLAVHIFVGVAAGYTAAVAVSSVLVPQLSGMIVSGDYLQLTVPLVLLGMLFLKFSPQLARLGNPASGFLVGVGAAVAVGGAIQGTLLPQMSSGLTLFATTSAGAPFLTRLLDGLLILVGMVTSMAYFHFSARNNGSMPDQRARWIELLAKVGHGFIAVTLGVVFAGVFSAALSALIERFDFIVNFVLQFLGGA